MGESAVRYKLAIEKYLSDHHIMDISALVTFSGEVIDPDSGPETFTEKSMNPPTEGPHLPRGTGTPTSRCSSSPTNTRPAPVSRYCAMYVDKRLDGVQAVQALSRLNRIYPGKVSYIFDFANHTEDVLAAFKNYYQGAELNRASDPNLIFDQ